LLNRIVGEAPVHGDAERREGDGRDGSKESGEALRAQNVSSIENGDTTIPPTRKRTTYSVISRFLEF